MPRFDVIAFDADDTLWHNERLYLHTQARLVDLLAPYGVDGQPLKIASTRPKTEISGFSDMGSNRLPSR